MLIILKLLIKKGTDTFGVVGIQLEAWVFITFFLLYVVIESLRHADLPSKKY